MARLAGRRYNMCQATVFLGDEKIAQEVIRLDQVEEGVQIARFFEEPQLVTGRIQTIDFLKNRVILQPVGKGENERN
jgi:predicted RNA-binding protein